MIYEYALDPKLVVEWAISRKGAYVGQFGLDHRRLVSDFPQDWEGQVSGALYERFDFDDTSLEFQNTAPMVNAYVQILSDVMVKRKATIPDGQSWIDAAIVEHAKQPFQGIMIANRAAHEPECVITPDAIEDLRNTHWYIPTIKLTKKNAEGIANALQPMLSRASTIVLVDPYFKADQPRYISTFFALINCAMAGRDLTKGNLSVTLMTGVEQSHNPRDGEFTEQQKQRVANDLCVKAQEHISKLLPLGLVLNFYCLQNPIKGDPLHNRFVLTDIGGVIVPYGLDEYKPGEKHEAMDDLQPMQKGIFTDRWAQYGERKGIHIVRAPEQIIGTRKD
jgi:hypothetical protein